MLARPTLDKLHQLRLTGMARAYEQQLAMPEIETLSAEERLGLMVDCEVTERGRRRLKTRLRRAKLRHNAAIEDIDYRHPRGLDKSLVTKLANANWVREHHNLLLTGPTGRLPSTPRGSSVLAPQAPLHGGLHSRAWALPCAAGQSCSLRGKRQQGGCAGLRAQAGH